MDSLKEKIKYYRENKKISKSELARIIGVSPAYITKLENGTKENPSLEVLIKISNALDIDINNLIDIKKVDSFNYERLNFLRPEENKGFYFKVDFSEDKKCNSSIIHKSDFFLMLKKELEKIDNIDDFFKLTLSWLPWNDLQELSNDDVQDLIHSLSTMYKFKLFEFKHKS